MYNLTGQNFISRVRSIYPDVKIASGGSELVVRCPYCGDSRDRKHAHLYISVPKSEEDVSLYNCMKCSAKGVVGVEFLRKLGCDDTTFMVEVSKHNSEVFALPRYKTLKSINIYPLKNDFIRNLPTNAEKLAYINNRIGSNFSYADLQSLKIFLNLGDVIYRNRLELTRHKQICEALDRWFIGFISFDNSYCGMRNLLQTDDQRLPRQLSKRYINYSLINKTDSSKNFYVIPTTIDTLNPEPVKIHLAEGQFDILSIFYNLCGSRIDQSAYIACTGKSYSQALEFILTETGIMNYEIHYYPDKDVDDNEFYDLVLKRIARLPCDVYVHRNTFPSEKDFGVPKDRIRDFVTKVRQEVVF